MTLRFQLFDPASCRFPRPTLAMTPYRRGWRGGDAAWVSLFRGSQAQYFRMGRYALAAALRLAGVGPGRGVLMPAYHCRTMVDPVVSLGAEPIFYPLTGRLEPNWEEIDQRVMSSSTPIRALVLTHYFGWPQDARRARSWCDERGLDLVEDCSHRPWGLREDHLPGRWGDFATTSPHKLAPLAPGGILIRRVDGPPVAITPPTGKDQWRALWHGLQGMWRSQAHPGALTALPDELARLCQTDQTCGTDEVVQGDTAPSDRYQREAEGQGGLWWCRWPWRRVSLAAISQARRRRYNQWLAGLADAPACRPLFPDLPEEVTPAFFPLLIEHPAPHFYLLKRLGAPIWRWDELAVSDCPVAGHYRLHLLHLPCHQDLSDTDMEWMLTHVNAVMRTSPLGGARD